MSNEDVWYSSWNNNEIPPLVKSVIDKFISISTTRSFDSARLSSSDAGHRVKMLSAQLSNYEFVSTGHYLFDKQNIVINMLNDNNTRTQVLSGTFDKNGNGKEFVSDLRYSIALTKNCENLLSKLETNIMPETKHNSVESLKKSSNKYTLNDENNGIKQEINTNKDVLNYFKQYDKDNKINQWQESGLVETEIQFHYLDYENPIRLASVLNHEFKTEIKVESMEKYTSNEMGKIDKNIAVDMDL